MVNFISLGGWCGPKMALKNAGLFDRPSLPFDDVRTSIEGVIDCIETDFRNYFPKEIKKDDRFRNYAGFVGEHVGFYHHPIHNLYDSNVVESFKRKIERFGMSIKENDCVFIRTIVRDYELEYYKRLQYAIDQKYPGTRFMICFVIPDQDVTQYYKNLDDRTFLFTLNDKTTDGDNRSPGDYTPIFEFIKNHGVLPERHINAVSNRIWLVDDQSMVNKRYVPLKNMKLLWVTAFRDLKRDQWGASNRTFEFYMECFRRIAGPLSPHLVCFADEPQAEQVRNLGVKVCPYGYEDTLIPKHLGLQSEILCDPSFKSMIPEFLRLCPEFNIPEYGLVNCAKTSFLRRASELFPEYTHYAWIDFGYAKTPSEAPPESPFVCTSLVNPDKILISSFRNAIFDKDGDPALCPYGIQTTENPVKYNWNNPVKCLQEPPHIIQGNLFVVPRKLTRWLEMCMNRSIERHHDLRIVRSDELFFLPILHDFRSKFHLHIKTESDMNWIRVRQPDVSLRDSIFRIIDRIPYVDENGDTINHHWLERNEQIIAHKYVPRDAAVLELGARYGTVSCVINSILNDAKRHVVVDPDTSIIPALKSNRSSHGAQFHIFNGVVSRKPLYLQQESYCTYTVSNGTTPVSSLTIEELEKVYGMTFNCLVADCEGFMEQFVRENLEFVRRLDTIIYEEDCPEKCDYYYVYDTLKHYGFTCIHTELNYTLRYRVWKKSEPQGYFLLANGEKYIRMLLDYTLPSIRKIDPHRPISIFTSTPELFSEVEGLDHIIQYDPEKEYEQLGIPLDMNNRYDVWGLIPRFLQLSRSPYDETLSLDCDLVCLPNTSRLEQFWEACTSSGQNMVAIGESNEANRGPSTWHWGHLDEVIEKTGVNIPQIGGQCVYYRKCPDFLQTILPYYKTFEAYGIKPWLTGYSTSPSEEIFYALYMGLKSWRPIPVSEGYIEHMTEYVEPRVDTLFVQRMRMS